MARKKNKLLKTWNFILNVVMHIISLVFGAAMVSGDLSLESIKWLAWIQPAVVFIGWFIIIVTVGSAIVTVIEFIANF